MPVEFDLVPERFVKSLKEWVDEVDALSLNVRRLKFEVQHWLVANEALIGCFVFMSFSGSVV